ncbi:nucleotidyltransferase family protein [archaeon]|jgi:mannose-1-phosphate guanylyltransferase|nr:nucleotidyltransferase family protein [archaeon]MBT4350906.1 nucleotidyltransferase family protein [archaeon]MBT4648330.1 nucleotidyltransferase family protein [archaeon]MBT6822319.1 nucleotidyltransferase family protein [archaeon]MBT7391786.1 nucleotidyltransferase family protein [archaeon]
MKERITITLDKSIIHAIDNKIDKIKIKNRSHAIELYLSRSLGNSSPKKAILLLGGKGTRFRPITYELPKALLPIKGRTVPEHLIDLFKKYHITELVFSVGYKAEKIKEYFGDGKKLGINITYVKETKPMGSAGAIKLAKKYLTETFIVTNGDELKDIDLEEMFKFHKQNKALVTAALTTVKDPSAYGVAKLEGNKILEFVEKPPKNKAPSNLINSGLSIWEPGALDLIPKGFSMYEQDVFPILAKKKKLYGYPFSGQWFDTGTPERYERAIKMWKGLSKE